MAFQAGHKPTSGAGRRLLRDLLLTNESEVQLQTELHAPRLIELALHAAEVRVLNVGASRRRAEPVQRVEHLPAEIDPRVFADREGFREGEILVEVERLPHFRIVTGRVARPVRGLRAEESRRLEVAIRTFPIG